MMIQPELLAAHQRYEDLQREVKQIQFANRIARQANQQSLISRMVKLLAGSRDQLQQEPQPKANVAQHRLASAKPR